MKRPLVVTIFPLLLAACGGSTDPNENGAAGASGGDISNEGTPLRVEVPSAGRVFVTLNPPAVVTPELGAEAPARWDLAFEGLDVYTNSGPSGPGNGGGFGPGDTSLFFEDTKPEVPFIQQDETGGAFRGWYMYSSDTHALWSRYHVYGLRDADRLWKVQILSYYGDMDGAPTSGLYQVRYAEVLASGATDANVAENVDGTAGGPSAPGDVPSECLDLASGARVMLTPEEARASSDWQLCFRRDAISVNGELGGPRGVGAVDIDAESSGSETIEEVMKKTAASEEPQFDAVSFGALTDAKLSYRGDRVVSVFSGQWIEPGASPPAPIDSAWLVVGADGASSFLVVFERFEGATQASPGAVFMRIKPVT